MIDGDVLWLAYERVGHPESVRYPANIEDVEFLLGLLQRSRSERTALSHGLRNYLEREEVREVFSRRTIPVRGANGLYRLVSWRLARWMAKGLVTEGSVRTEVQQKLRMWLGERIAVAPGKEHEKVRRLTLDTG